MARVAFALLAPLLLSVLLSPPAAAGIGDVVVCVTNEWLTGMDPAGVAGCTNGSQGFIFIVGLTPTFGSGPLVRLAAVPAGWTCTSQGLPVATGDPLATADPEVTCSPPAGAMPPTCDSVGVMAGYGNAAGSVTATSSCGPLSAAWTTAPGSPAFYNWATGSEPFPLTCSVDTSQVAGPHFWTAWCDANLL